MLNQLKKYPAPLRISIVEGMMASIMSGGGMVFVVPFAVFLGANSFEVGLLTAIPALLAAWFQIGSIKLIQIYKNRKSIVLFTVALQAVSWIAIALIPFIFPMQQVGWLIALTTISVVVGTIGAPLWQSWMRSLTPKEILGEYFGVRNALTGAVVFLATLLGGLALNLAEPSVTLYAFVGIFIASFIGRAISAGLFSKIEEPKFLYNPREVIGIGHYIKQLGKDNFGHFVLFGTLMTFTIGMITPFISLYFLEGLGLNNNYLLYTILISASTLTAVISMPHWGRMIDKFGTIKLLQTTGLIVCFYPLLLVFVRDPVGLLIVQLFDGVVFGGFNLCLANFIYESFKPEKIIKYATIQSVLFGTATFIGTVLSGYIQMLNFTISFLITPFFTVCFISFVARIAIFYALSWQIKEIRETTRIDRRKLLMEVLTLEPLRETVHDNFVLLLSATTSAIHKMSTATVNKISKVEEAAAKEIGLIESKASKEIKNAERIAYNDIYRAEKTALKRIKKASLKRK